MLQPIARRQYKSMTAAKFFVSHARVVRTTYTILRVIIVTYVRVEQSVLVRHRRRHRRCWLHRPSAVAQSSVSRSRVHKSQVSVSTREPFGNSAFVWRAFDVSLNSKILTRLWILRCTSIKIRWMLRICLSCELTVSRGWWSSCRTYVRRRDTWLTFTISET